MPTPCVTCGLERVTLAGRSSRSFWNHHEKRPAPDVASGYEMSWLCVDEPPFLAEQGIYKWTYRPAAISEGVGSLEGWVVTLPRRTFSLCAFSGLHRIPLPTPRLASVRNCRVQDRFVGWQAWRGISSAAPDYDAPSEAEAPLTKSGRRTTRFISSLDPNTLDAKDFVDISGLVAAQLHFKLSPTLAQGVRYKSCLGENGKRRVRVPFPPGTRGFFYFRHSHQHAAAGEIRFRIVRREVAPLPVSEAFALGSDLIRPDGITPWGVHVLNVFHSYPAIRNQLVAEGLVSGAQARQIDGILASGVNPGPVRILENLAEAFIWKLRNPTPAMLILDREGYFFGWPNISLATPERVALNANGRTGTRSGKALVRFELAKLEPDGEPKVVIRVLKIIEPPKLEDAKIANEIFREGELVHKYNMLTRRRRPWSTTRSAEDRFITPSSRKVLEEMYLPKGEVGASTKAFALRGVTGGRGCWVYIQSR
ncbi:hypothetical protein FA13DRAFT_1871271 [Coprinellus micaceus]|uniref:Uncharacterized protein n=1 Tax=Coprinellus micaceus TaxID=71717 RepID=A0A4Y7T3G7_COPMI|nr:hypothetical protein FA13DRAFT_1871271 [Coprinellus micaceus]